MPPRLPVLSMVAMSPTPQPLDLGIAEGVVDDPLIDTLCLLEIAVGSRGDLVGGLLHDAVRRDQLRRGQVELALVLEERRYSAGLGEIDGPVLRGERALHLDDGRGLAFRPHDVEHLGAVFRILGDLRRLRVRRPGAARRLEPSRLGERRQRDPSLREAGGLRDLDARRGARSSASCLAGARSRRAPARSGTPRVQKRRRRSSGRRGRGSSSSVTISAPAGSTHRRCRESPPLTHPADPCSTASSSVADRPPSEKLSGVALTIPITRGTRSATTRAASRFHVLIINLLLLLPHFSAFVFRFAKTQMSVPKPAPNAIPSPICRFSTGAGQGTSTMPHDMLVTTDWLKTILALIRMFAWSTSGLRHHSPPRTGRRGGGLPGCPRRILRSHIPGAVSRRLDRGYYRPG